ncbi:MAG: hypothetical protein IJ767_07980, partial [Bacteroidaceae bacterium]|nr:hypothetical protein [Bacteroidaceae bacterium]
LEVLCYFLGHCFSTHRRYSSVSRYKDTYVWGFGKGKEAFILRKGRKKLSSGGGEAEDMGGDKNLSGHLCLYVVVTGFIA